MEVWLLNAAHMKAVPRRKTDVKDAEWIAQLLEHGLLRPSFVPPPDIRRLRMLTRYRVQLMGDRTREITRLELMLEDASIKLSSVAASLTSVSARAMLAAMIDGERDPRVLAELAKGKMRRKIPAPDRGADRPLRCRARPAGAQHAGPPRPGRGGAGRAERGHRRRRSSPWAHQIELLQTIPGVGEKVAQVIIAETGADMSRFPTAAHLAAWAGVAPGDPRVRRQALPGAPAARQQVAGRDAGRGGRLGRPDEGRQLPGRPARPADQPPGHGPGPGRGRALDPGLGLLHAHPRRALPRPRPGLATPAATTRPTPAGWSPSSNASATPSSSTRPPDRTGTTTGRTGSARPALTRACNSPIHGSVCG